MPSEIRHVLFTHAEVLEAVLDHWRRVRQPLPKGNVVGTDFDTTKPGGPFRFELKVATDNAPNAPRSYTVEDLELVQVLITYCRGRSIPLPMKADKALQKFGARVGLVLTLGAKGGEKVSLT